MPFNGTGTFSPKSPEYPAVTGTTILAASHNAIVADIAAGLSNTMPRDGQAAATSAMNMGGNKITNLATGVNASDAVTVAQVGALALGTSPALTGVPTAPTAAAGTNTTQIATTQFVTTAVGNSLVSHGGNNAVSNTAVGTSALLNNTSGTTNVAVGEYALTANTSGNTNVAVGSYALAGNTTASHNIAIGRVALFANTTGNDNTAVGHATLVGCTSGYGNTAVGQLALNALTTAALVTGIGDYAGEKHTTGTNCTYLGAESGKLNTTGSSNTALGNAAMAGNVVGSFNTMVGWKAGLTMAPTGGQGANTAVGSEAFMSATTGSQNVAIGANAMDLLTTGNENTAIGLNAGAAITTESNCVCLGKSAGVTGSNQVQLGNSATTTYAYGAVQARSDLRDKTDVRPTILGLDFINAQTPIDYKWDYREDYIPPRPAHPGEEASTAEIKAFKTSLQAWKKSTKRGEIAKTGEHKRTRFHHGLGAQNVQSCGFEFGGLQDHKLAGGEDVLSIGYEEFIGPLIKAIQELDAKFEAYKATHP